MPSKKVSKTVFPCGKADDQGDIVGLHLGLVGGTATGDGTAFFTTVYDNVSLFGVWLGADRA